MSSKRSLPDTAHRDGEEDRAAAAAAAVTAAAGGGDDHDGNPVAPSQVEHTIGS